MEYQIFEVKFEIDKESEERIAEDLWLNFDSEQVAIDHYLKDGLKN